MNKIPLILFLFFYVAACGQIVSPVRGEFANQANGLMYPDSTMQQLRHMVDSLNLGFKSCSNNAVFYSMAQGKACKMEFSSPTNALTDIRKDMAANMDYRALAKKHKQWLVKIDTNCTVIRGNDYYLLGGPLHGYEEDYNLNDKKKKENKNWVWSFTAKGEYDWQKKNELYAYYFPGGLTQAPIPAEYGRYIQYVDCMIDTSREVFTNRRKDDTLQDMSRIPPVTVLNNYFNSSMKLKPKKNELYYDYDFNYITDDKYQYALQHFQQDDHFKSMVSAAADACIQHGTGSPAMEQLTNDFVSKTKALELMRHHLVMGSCSQDASPRYHARDIALKAAETNQWDIFLRAHMDIMNDRFERASDGSYAYARRKTYLKELELLHLDIVDLMIGLSLRASNTANHHYNGTIWRLGWALTESKDSSLFEQKAKEMIKDERLDAFNRGLLFLLYQTYLYSLPDRINANRKITTLKNERAVYAKDIQSAIQQLKLRDSKEKREIL